MNSCSGKCDKPRMRYLYRMQVQKPTTTPDAHGHIDTSSDAAWQNAGTIRCRFITKGGREWRHNEQIEAVTTHIIETPASGFSRTIHPEWRGVFNGRKFNFTAAYNVNEDRGGVVRIEATEAR